MASGEQSSLAYVPYHSRSLRSPSCGPASTSASTDEPLLRPVVALQCRGTSWAIADGGWQEWQAARTVRDPGTQHLWTWECPPAQGLPPCLPQGGFFSLSLAGQEEEELPLLSPCRCPVVVYPCWRRARHAVFLCAPGACPSGWSCGKVQWLVRLDTPPSACG